MRIPALLTLLVVASSSPCRAASKAVDSVLLVGWDGARRERLQGMLAAGELPNLAKLIAEGGLTLTQITTGATETKPGWSEILTGRSADALGVKSNTEYRPIPKGYTVFEILKERFPRIVTIFLAGKTNNVAARGPHVICINCWTRMPPDFEQTRWWDKDNILPKTRTWGDQPRRWVARAGEPYFNAVKSIDDYRISLGAADNVGKAAIAVLEGLRGARFFAFVHFEDPDEQGHRHGEGSPEYAEAIRSDDRWLGRLLDELKSSGAYDRTAVFVTTDHGFDEGRHSHMNAPNTWLATNVKRPLRKDGDRKDATPTMLDALGVDPKSIRPTLDGRSLFAAPR